MKLFNPIAYLSKSKKLRKIRKERLLARATIEEEISEFAKSSVFQEKYDEYIQLLKEKNNITIHYLTIEDEIRNGKNIIGS